ncbi:MAG: MOSC domain-containing protein [Actinobacteria bacterium]|nr:MOSC domain-containing protein [Actinomycetota bacterium]
MAVVVRLSVTPVKSTALVHPEEVFLDRDGVPGNRRFHLVNEAGRLLSASRDGRLLTLRSSYEPGREWLEIAFPDGRVVAGMVQGGGERRTTVFWGRPVEGEVVEGPWAGEVAGFLGRPVTLLRTVRPGDANDSHPCSIVSAPSVAELGRRAGVEGPVDARRFRMLVEVDGVRPHEEDAWVGRSVRIGEAEVRVVRTNPRCVVTTLDPGTGRPDLDTLGVVARYRPRTGNGIPFGVYADVERPGRIRVGDAVDPLDPLPA